MTEKESKLDPPGDKPLDEYASTAADLDAQNSTSHEHTTVTTVTPPLPSSGTGIDAAGTGAGAGNAVINNHNPINSNNTSNDDSNYDDDDDDISYHTSNADDQNETVKSEPQFEKYRVIDPFDLSIADEEDAQEIQEVHKVIEAHEIGVETHDNDTNNDNHYSNDVGNDIYHDEESGKARFDKEEDDDMVVIEDPYGYGLSLASFQSSLFHNDQEQQQQQHQQQQQQQQLQSHSNTTTSTISAQQQRQSSEHTSKLLIQHITRAGIGEDNYESFKSDDVPGTVGAGADSKSQLPCPSGCNSASQTLTHLQNGIHPDLMSPALKRRLRDFQFAQKKRRDRYGEQNPWGIIGLYDHLTGIRIDIEWAEDAAWRRENEQPYLSWQDFEDAKDTGFNQPFFTYFTMAICTVCLIVSFGLNNWTIDSVTNNPMIGPKASVLILMGAKYTPKIVNENQWFRIFTAMFLHAGIIHYIVNMLALWFIGYAVEQSHGFSAAALLFILPAIGGTLLSALFLPEYISVGASGGIFGLIGACLADITSNWGLLFSKHVNEKNDGRRFRHIKVLIWLGLDIILNIVIGLTPFVDNFTHMGGMFFGFLCGLSTMKRLSKAFFGVKTNLLSQLQTFLVRFFGIIFTVICVIIASIVLVSLQNGTIIKCPGCRYVSCVPFPFWETENKWWYCDDCNKPVVKAQLYQDTSTSFYTHMDLTCPDNSTIYNITLTENHKNKEVIKGQLSNICREECDVLFSN